MAALEDGDIQNTQPQEDAHAELCPSVHLQIANHVRREERQEEVSTAIESRVRISKILRLSVMDTIVLGH